ncbi:MAG: hypothetical protein AMJ56_14740 [Anaerolineae bacterium SG8_19]|nr:MAG: hypothetical protein AMJ56_14740 [Anaerolineae bacterium SG8_19]HCB49900.1 hypothetical protein [Chloroflexota bacterium]
MWFESVRQLYFKTLAQHQGLQQGHNLTLVSAPAGFGKSTLFSEWLAGSERSIDCATKINREMMVGTSGDLFLGSSSASIVFDLPKLQIDCPVA